jgi:hypothetical protein
MENMTCLTCGYKGRSVTITKGSLGLEIVLWLLMIFPGVLYTLWRLTTRSQGCPKCKNTKMIPSDSPILAQK